MPKSDPLCVTCGHPASHHDAGECWTDPTGQETYGETSCPCNWLDTDPPTQFVDETMVDLGGGMVVPLAEIMDDLA